MFTSLISTVAAAVATSVAGVVKTKAIIRQIGNSCPTQCILDEQDA